MRARLDRGITIVTVLLVLAGAAAVAWIVTYGPAYWDNVDVNRDLKEAANLCYRQPDDELVRQWMWGQLHQKFDTGERGPDGLPEMLIDVQRDDFRIERIDSPKWVHIWLTYRRTIRVPLLGQEREITFVDHVDQDLAPVKW